MQVKNATAVGRRFQFKDGSFRNVEPGGILEIGEELFDKEIWKVLKELKK